MHGARSRWSCSACAAQSAVRSRRAPAATRPTAPASSARRACRALNETLAQFERDTSNQVLVSSTAPAGRTPRSRSSRDRLQGLGRRPEGQGQRRRVLRVRRRPADAHRGRLRARGRAARHPRRQHLEDHAKPRFRAATSRAAGGRRRPDHARRPRRAVPGDRADARRGRGGAPDGPPPFWMWLVPLGALALGSRGPHGERATQRWTRGAATTAIATAFGTMVATVASQDGRMLAIGFGFLLLGAAPALWFGTKTVRRQEPLRPARPRPRDRGRRRLRDRGLLGAALLPRGSSALRLGRAARCCWPRCWPSPWGACDRRDPPEALTFAANRVSGLVFFPSLLFAAFFLVFGANDELPAPPRLGGAVRPGPARHHHLRPLARVGAVAEVQRRGASYSGSGYRRGAPAGARGSSSGSSGGSSYSGGGRQQRRRRGQRQRRGAPRSRWSCSPRLWRPLRCPPRPDRDAMDGAGVVEAARLSALNETLAQFERETSNQVLVYVDRTPARGRLARGFANASPSGRGRSARRTRTTAPPLRVRGRPADADRGRLRLEGALPGHPRRQHHRGLREAAVPRERFRRRYRSGRGADHARRRAASRTRARGGRGPRRARPTGRSRPGTGSSPSSRWPPRSATREALPPGTAGCAPRGGRHRGGRALAGSDVRRQGRPIRRARVRLPAAGLGAGARQPRAAGTSAVGCPHGRRSAAGGVRRRRAAGRAAASSASPRYGAFRCPWSHTPRSPASPRWRRGGCSTAPTW